MAALAVWLLFRLRERANSAPVHPVPWALLLLIPCSFAALVFWKAGIQALQVLMLPALIWSAVFAAFGAAVARLVAVPIAYLYFAMPAWNLLNVPLQELTVRVVGLIAPIMGLPASVSGTTIAFPNGASFVVTVACSGVGFLTQGLAVATLLGELEDAGVSRRLRLLGAMLAVTLLTNWIRVLLLVLIGYAAGMDNAIVAHRHLEFGYILFVIVLVAFVWFATRVPAPQCDPKVPPGTRVLSGYMAAVIALTAGPILVFLITPSEVATPAWQLPAGQNSWVGPTPLIDGQWHPVFVGAHALEQGTYQDQSGNKVEAVGVLYALQHQGRELVNEGNTILGDGGLSASTMDFVDAGETTYVEMEATDKAGNRSVIWSVYDIGGRSFVVPLLSQLWYGVRALGKAPYSAQFAFRAACDPSCDSARGTLRSFVQGMSPNLLSVTSWVASRTEAAHLPHSASSSAGKATS